MSIFGKNEMDSEAKEQIGVVFDDSNYAGVRRTGYCGKVYILHLQISKYADPGLATE